MKISELYKKDRRTLSFEIFPPKREENLNNIDETLSVLCELKPDFISVTFGAGGSANSNNTIAIAKKIKNAAQSFIKSNDLQSLFDITGNDYPKVKIYHAKNGDINTSALLVEEKDETFFVVLKGAFNLGGLLQGAIQGGGAI